MPDILDTERPVDRHVRNPAQSSATGKHHRIPFDARAPRNQCPDNPESLFSIRVEVVTELRPDKNPAMETDKRDPFRLPARPAKRFQRSLSPAQVLDHGSPNGPLSPRLRFCQIGPRRQGSSSVSGIELRRDTLHDTFMVLGSRTKRYGDSMNEMTPAVLNAEHYGAHPACADRAARCTFATEPGPARLAAAPAQGGSSRTMERARLWETGESSFASLMARR